MSVSKYRPLSLWKDLQSEMNQLFGGVSGMMPTMPGVEDMTTMATSHWSPHVDVKEEADRYLIFADIPGVDPKNIKVSMEGNRLTVEGERTFENKKEDAEKTYSRVERFFGKFCRQFQLPNNANGEGITAKGKHGVLEITIPKYEKEKPKQINISVEE